MKASRCIRLWVGLFFLGVTFHTVTAASNDIHVVVNNILDMRDSGNMVPRCQVQLGFSGSNVADAFGIHDIRITTAVDDTGHDLRADESQDLARRHFTQGTMASFQGVGYYIPQLTHTVALLSPARDAHTIKTLEGEADLLYPTPENGGLVIVKDFLAHPGEAYADPLLKKSNVTIAYLGKEGDEANNSNKTAQAVPPVPLDPGSDATPPLPFQKTSGAE